MKNFAEVLIYVALKVNVSDGPLSSKSIATWFSWLVQVEVMKINNISLYFFV